MGIFNRKHKDHTPINAERAIEVPFKDPTDAIFHSIVRGFDTGENIHAESGRRPESIAVE